MLSVEKRGLPISDVRAFEGFLGSAIIDNGPYAVQPHPTLGEYGIYAVVEKRPFRWLKGDSDIGTARAAAEQAIRKPRDHRL